FVSLAMGLPLLVNGYIKYVNVPINCKLYDKTKTKLELAAELIEEVVPQLKDYQVIVLCDAWYTKKPFLSRVLAFDFVELIGAVRVDTATYELPPPPTGKRGRPRKKGNRIDYTQLNYSAQASSENLQQATVECLTNLTERLVYATYTTTNVTSFSSVRLYISTLPLDRIRSFTVIESQGLDLENKPKLSDVFSAYRMRWPIEVMFYQEKTFWSFGKYMVRSKVGIEKYAHLVGVTYALTILLPFIYSDFSKYQFQSPQEIKYSLGAKLHDELIMDNLLKTLQLKKNTAAFSALLEYLNSEDIAS
ncbi:MAG: transposase, partial [Cellulosilyticaceae bacterium]